MDSVHLPQTSPNKESATWSGLARDQQGGTEQLYISGTMWLTYCMCIWMYKTAHPEWPYTPQKTVICPQPLAIAGAIAFRICCCARLTPAYEVIKCYALLFNKGVIWGEGGDVVLAGISQGTGGTTSCKIFSSCWLYTSSWSFHSSFTGSEGGGAAGRDSGPLMMLFSISSCLRLALGSGTVPQEVFMLNRSLVTLDVIAEMVMQRNVYWKESMRKSAPSLNFPVQTHLLLCKLPGVIQKTNKRYLSIEKDRLFHHCFPWMLQHKLLKWTQHPSICL